MVKAIVGLVGLPEAEKLGNMSICHGEGWKANIGAVPLFGRCSRDSGIPVCIASCAFCHFLTASQLAALVLHALPEISASSCRVVLAYFLTVLIPAAALAVVHFLGLFDAPTCQGGVIRGNFTKGGKDRDDRVGRDDRVRDYEECKVLNEEVVGHGFNHRQVAPSSKYKSYFRLQDRCQADKTGKTDLSR